jgi:prenyltransferase beta subunit
MVPRKSQDAENWGCWSFWVAASLKVFSVLFYG